MGNELFQKVTELTGLPSEMIGKELLSMLENKGYSADTLTMEELRTVLSEYLQEILMRDCDPRPNLN